MIRYFTLFLLYFLSLYSIDTIASEADDHQDEKEPIQLINGQTVIVLDEAIQETSGLKTVILNQVEFQPEFIAYGQAVDITPLLKIRNQYFANNAQSFGAKARYLQAEKSITRLRNLHQNDVISTRKLLKQQSQLQSDKALYDASTYRNQNIINRSQIQWGVTVTQWTIDKISPKFNQLVNGNITLLRVILPVGKSLASTIRTLVISPEGNRSSATKAILVSNLPQVEPVSQGLQYLFQTKDPMIKMGMHFTAWIPHHKQKTVGVIIPESSLVWHLGQAFVFIKIEAEQFIHRNIDQPIKVPDGYFVANQITNGEEIVVTGTQMLLSHEFRSQIPDEDDDD